MKRVIIAPAKYVQGEGVLSFLGEHVNVLGQRPVAIASPSVMKKVENTVVESLREYPQGIRLEQFNRECCRSEIERLQTICEASGADVLIGIGGGKAIDTAKAIAYYCRIPVVVVPTIASTDAPTSAVSVLYTEEGVFSEYLFFPRNPDLVLVDTRIIANAPERLLVAGMGDALATFFEARACYRAGRTTNAGGATSQSAYALAELCYQTLLADGLKARLAVTDNTVSAAVENIVEANTFLSGVGFESGGLAAAHAIHNGLTCLDACHAHYHGEKVAFGTLAQLLLENAPLAEIREVLAFCQSVGLPVTLGDLGVEDVSAESLMPVAEATCAKGETIHNMPFPVSVDAVLSAMLSADRLGHLYREQGDAGLCL
ncbi:glycerol dehydrogenase [Kistimonas asteriae]|uniref:glycerol dehydrogenase n=1 Tax=Kistimonas asteriae TaxID=517724 RepID=UPI001BA95F3D|nr:glycerol dehydrogenase [Kistimonas asteriae]